MYALLAQFLTTDVRSWVMKHTHNKAMGCPTVWNSENNRLRYTSSHSI